MLKNWNRYLQMLNRLIENIQLIRMRRVIFMGNMERKIQVIVINHHKDNQANKMV